VDIGVFYWWNYTTGLTKKNWWIILVELPTVIPVGGHDGSQGVSINGVVSPIAGWFISWKTLLKWMMKWSIPISGNLHLHNEI
jgi:hypothetical protein